MTRQSGAQSPARQITAPQRNQGDSTAPGAIDLDSLNADQVLELWSRVEKAKATRDADPELRTAILKRCGQLNDRDLGATIRKELDEASPAVVLEAHFAELVPNRPALGAFRGAWPRRARLDTPSADEWLKEDPRRLAGVVVEMRRFSSDLPKIVQSVLDLADSLSIEADLADRIVTGALRDARRSGHAS